MNFIWKGAISKDKKRSLSHVREHRRWNRDIKYYDSLSLKCRSKRLQEKEYCKIEWSSVTKLPLFLSYSELLYLLIVGVEGYCCAWSHSMTHTHTNTHSRTPLDECRPVTTQHLQKHIPMPPAGFEPMAKLQRINHLHQLILIITINISF
jgi:hypothetical protein